ncbi:MAG: TlpA family protein disulfide reductase [Anaerolineae bacterium]|nr:TlpA family protein disulfide reductase [Anaerolineae bacterium]
MSRLARRIAALGCFSAAAILIWAVGLPERAAYLSPRSFRAGETPIAPEVGALAPPLRGLSPTGSPFDLNAYRGTPLILNFWATWCAPCIQEMPILEKFHQRGVMVVGINVGDSPSTILAWAEQYHITFPLVLDPTGQMSRQYRLLGLPATFQIDSAGVVRRVKFGALSESELEDWTDSERQP